MPVKYKTTLMYLADKGDSCFCSTYRKKQLKLKSLTQRRPNAMVLWPMWGFSAPINNHFGLIFPSR